MEVGAEEYGGGLGRVRSALEDHLQGGGGIGKEVNFGHMGAGRKPSQEERRGMHKRKHLSIEGGTLSGKGNGDTTDPTSSMLNLRQWMRLIHLLMY